MQREFYSLLADETEPHPLDGTIAPAVIRLLEKDGLATLEYDHESACVRVTPTREGKSFVARYQERFSIRNDVLPVSEPQRTAQRVHDALAAQGVRFPALHDSVLVEIRSQTDMADAVALAVAAIHDETRRRPRDTPGGSFEPQREAYAERAIREHERARRESTKMHIVPERAELFARIRHALQRGLRGDRHSALEQIGTVLEDILGRDDIAIVAPAGCAGNYVAEIQAAQAAVALLEALGV